MIIDHNYNKLFIVGVYEKTETKDMVCEQVQ